MKDEILKNITDFYLESGDFNGIPIRTFEISQDELKKIIIKLIKEQKISIVFGDIHPNPHIQALPPEPIKQQLQKIEKLNLQDACLYPTENHFKKVVDKSKYEGKPFTLKLALGEPQLAFYSFDLSVLETYRNDPRYSYDNDDVSGSIGVRDQYYQSTEMQSSDQVLLQTFGFSYDSNMNRAVATYLRYLADLSPEHQRIWHAKIVSGNYKLHPDYHRSTMGHWPEGISIFAAFSEELHQINEMCKIIGRPSLFKKEFREGERPKNFTFLIRPTLEEFNNFVHLLDKMVSENINLDFFKNKVPFEEQEQRPDGTIVAKQKGSIRILEDWINKNVSFIDPVPKDEMIGVLKKIRKMRQKPAHAVNENIFDQKYFKEQRDLIIEAYNAVRRLRLLLSNHPKLKNYQVPDWLQTGTIWTR